MSGFLLFKILSFTTFIIFSAAVMIDYHHKQKKSIKEFVKKIEEKK